MKKRPSFYVMYKNFNNNDEIDFYDVMPSLYGSIFNSRGGISKKNFYIWDEKTYERKEITNKSELKKFIDRHFIYCYRFKCEWEFIVTGWPPKKDEKEIKVDVYQQLKPNIDVITDIVWEQIKNKIKTS